MARFALLLTIATCWGCAPVAPSDAPSGVAPAADNRITPEPGHMRLLSLPRRTPVEQAQLMLWESCRSRENQRSGVDIDHCEFVPGVQLPVHSRWQFDAKCTVCTLHIKWDPRIESTSDIQVAVTRVLKHHFLRNLDTFYFLHNVIDRGSAVQAMKSVNSDAVFYCEATRISKNELVLQASALPQPQHPTSTILPGYAQ